MAPIIIGIGLLLFGRYINRQKRAPEDVITVSGSVIDVRTRKSSIRRNRTLFGPVIAYDHPVTGRREELEPVSFYARSPEIGDTIEVRFIPGTGHTDRAPEYRWEHLVVPGFGVVMILLGIADLAF